MKMEMRVALVFRYMSSSTSRTSTILPSAGAITYCSPRGPARTGSRKKTSSHTAIRNRAPSGIHTQGDPRATHAPSSTSAHPGRMKGQPSGASLTAPPRPEGGTRKAERGTAGRGRSPHDTPTAVSRSAFRVPRSSCGLQRLPRDQFIGLQVPLARRPHHLRRQRRRRRVAVPFALLLQTREVVPQRLFVEAGLAPAGLITVRGPEARRVGGEDLVDHEQPAVRRRAELELRVGDDDAAPGGVLPARLVQGEAGPLQLVGVRAAQRPRHVRHGHVLVVPHLGLGGGREDRGIEPRALDQSPRERLARERAGLLVFRPGGAREVAAHHALERYRRRAADEHGPARQGWAMVAERRHPGHDLVGIGGEEVARDHRRQPLEPERAELREHRALVWHRLAQHHVERAHAVARHEQQGVGVDLVHLAHFAAPQERQGQGARHQRSRHTFTSAVATAGATASMRCSTPGSTRSRNSSTWRGARPTYAAGSSSPAASATCSALIAGSRARRSSRSFAAPCSAIAWATARLCVWITSCSRWRSPPAFTPRISSRSVARNGSWAATCRAITASRTSRPAATLVASTRMASLARNASGSTRRRLALSSSVRSSHCSDAVCQALPSSSITKRASPVIRSARIGLRLYAMADEPTWSLSNGSSISPSCCSRRRSVASLAADCARPDNTASTCASSFRV